MKRIMMRVAILWSLIVLIGMIGFTQLGIAADWVEIPVDLIDEDGIQGYGRAFAMEMPRNTLYIQGSIVMTNNTGVNRNIKNSYMQIYSRQPDGSTLDTVLGGYDFIAPEILEDKGISVVSFSGLVYHIPIESVGCRYKVESNETGYKCIERQIMNAEFYENDEGDLVFQVEFDQAVEYDCEILWIAEDKNQKIQWFEASEMYEGDSRASVRIPKSIRKGYIDDIENIGAVYADIYVRPGYYR